MWWSCQRNEAYGSPMALQPMWWRQSILQVKVEQAATPRPCFSVIETTKGCQGSRPALYFQVSAINKESHQLMRFFYSTKRNYKEELMLLNVFPIIGPRRVKAAITTIATKTRINAYSTRPWPFSLGANNMGYFLLSSEFPVRVHRSMPILHFR